MIKILSKPSERRTAYIKALRDNGCEVDENSFNPDVVEKRQRQAYEAAREEAARLGMKFEATFN